MLNRLKIMTKIPIIRYFDLFRDNMAAPPELVIFYDLLLDFFQQAFSFPLCPSTDKRIDPLDDSIKNGITSF